MNRALSAGDHQNQDLEPQGSQCLCNNRKALSISNSALSRHRVIITHELRLQSSAIYLVWQASRCTLLRTTMKEVISG
jgi:hypothetical protein